MTLCTLIVNCSLAFVDSILWLRVDHVCVKAASVNVVTPDQTYRYCNSALIHAHIAMCHWV